ncbi:MAG: rod shape-determining protein RodA [Candidatus Zixiibacteriota bacterium]
MRAIKTVILEFWNEVDRWLWTIGVILSLSGVALIYSSTHMSPNPVEQDLYLKQLFWIVLGLVAFWIVYVLPFRFFEAFAYLFYAAAILALVGVFFLGSTRLGATRWYDLGFLNLQPSELAKIATVFALARFLAYSSKYETNISKRLLPALFLALLPMLLILRQPDLGTSLVFFAIFLAMLFWSSIPAIYLFFIISPALSLLAALHWVSWGLFFILLLVVLYLVRPGGFFSTATVTVNLLAGMIMPLVWNRLHDYQKLRILIFLDPNRDPRGAGYQIIQSKIAVGSGGLLGKGYMGGTQTKLAFLPEQHTDFIFSVVGEEFGFLGVLALLALFGYLIYRGIDYAQKARNSFASFTALGITAVLTFQVLVNVGMTIGLMPVTGLPLPLVSYGGTSMITSWIMLGVLAGIGRRRYEY